MTATVDVLMPVYNAADTIHAAVASIQAQTYQDLRIVIVNDGSVDATRQIIEDLAVHDPRIVLINQANGGIVDALNTGLSVCSATFVARQDADDIARPDRFANQLGYLSRNSECNVVSGAIRHIDGAGRPLDEIYHLPSTDRADLRRCPQIEPYLSHPFLMMRRAACTAIGGYRHVFLAEDTDLYWRLQEHGRLHNMLEVLGDYRVHEQSITGASVLSGRISAVNSQRSGISALRRRARKPDLEFPKSVLEDYRQAVSLDGVIAVGGRDLQPDEAKWLAICTCAKLLELAGHRPYELELEDCATIGRILLPALNSMAPESRQYCTRILSGTAARLAAKGSVSAMHRLTPWQNYPLVVAKLALRVGVPTWVRRGIRSVGGRAGIMK